MSQVVIQKAYSRHEGTHWNVLGLLGSLLHVVALQIHGVTREDSELVEFNAVQKRSPGLSNFTVLGSVAYLASSLAV